MKKMAERLKKIFSLSQIELKTFMSCYLKDLGYKIIETPDYIIAEGEIPVALVAHLDTVSETPPEKIFFDEEHSVMWSPELLGADDRAGIYAILDILRDGYTPHIILTTDEERGCLGATAVVKDNPTCPLEKLNAIFQLDRQGEEDCVFYDCDNKDFIDFVSQYGFKEANGSFSDISVIAPAWEIAAVNLSVGYYNEHTYHEHLYLKELLETIDKVKKILKYYTHNETFFKYVAKEHHFKFSFNYGRKICEFCGSEEDVQPVKITEYLYDLCKECKDSVSAFVDLKY